MRHALYGVFWIGVYLVLTMSPIFVLLVGPSSPGRGFWRELSVGFGFAGLSMMGLQFFLTGRFRAVTSPYGIDVVYHFHRAISLIAFFFIILHPAALFLSSPATLALLNPLSAPGWITGGTVALLAFAVVVITSLYRLELGIRYERWRLIHGYVSVAAVMLSMVHIIGADYYLQGLVKRGLWIAMATAWMLALAYIRLIKPLMMRRNPYIVDRVDKERGDSWTLTLRPDGHRGMEFKPGQFAWLTIGKSPFSIREHPFSFSSSAMHPERLAFTIKELGDFTATAGHIPPGTRVYLDGPYGTFTTDRHAAPGYVFIAGGVGITPVMSILRTLADRYDARPLLLFYGSRDWEGATFREELAELSLTLNLRIIHVPAVPPEHWDGESGRISAELLARHLPGQRMAYEYFVCGPIPMQEAVGEALDKLGLPLEQIQSESFNFV